MNACGLLLCKDFPECPTPQDTLYCQNISRLQPAAEKSIFFNSHWVLSHFSEGEAYIYDSLQAKTLHPDLKKQLAALYGNFVNEVKSAPVQVQTGFQDCGCFAIAFAVSLFFGDNPSYLMYKQEEMRDHLADCITKQHLLPFPATIKKTKKQSRKLMYKMTLLLLLLLIFLICWIILAQSPTHAPGST